MSAPVWVAELAARFWSAAGSPPPFPRDLRTAAILALPLRIVWLPALRLNTVRDWLARLQLTCPVDEPDRPLRACLVTRAGFGFVFLDSDDPPDESRFSLAHEIAHFLRDYDAIRRAAATQLGPAALEVLDGRRLATTEERIHAVFRGVPVAAHVHLLRRDNIGRPLSQAERESESAADRLAFELLTPAEFLTGTDDRRELQEHIETRFGLPPIAAATYAMILRPPPDPIDPFVARLRKSS